MQFERNKVKTKINLWTKISQRVGCHVDHFFLVGIQEECHMEQFIESPVVDISEGCNTEQFTGNP